MSNSKKTLISLSLLFLVFTFSAAPAKAGGEEYERVVKHLKTKYQAKKVKIPMIWLARFAVRMVRPAGVKSFSLTTFENLQYTPETLTAEMQMALKNSFGSQWSPIFRARSRKGEQAFMYIREAGKDSIKVMVVTISDKQATVIRAAFSPEKLVDFMEDPKVLGISLNDDKQRANTKPAESNDNISIEKKADEQKK